MQLQEKADSSDRRRLRRFPAAELEAWVRQGGSLLGKWVKVAACDFTRAGLAIRSPTPLEPGTRLQLRLRLALDMGDIVADKLAAVVRNHRQDDGNGDLYGLEFDYEANRHMKSLELQSRLGRMEGILDRSEKLRKRLMTQEEVLSEL